jgi:uncharacterized protein YbbC (DUF1343 family)
MKRFLVPLLAFCLCCLTTSLAQVKVGADLLLEKHFKLIEGKRIGLVTNHSALLSDGRHLVDVLHADARVKLVALFAPEHGVRGDAPAGAKIQNEVDPRTGIPVYSLYGAITKPTDAMLKDVEVLLFDIQDVGVRFYTYLGTLSLAMEAAAERKIPYVVLDRPNPIRGTWVEGFNRDDSLRFRIDGSRYQAGWQPIVIAQGMTVGELANMFNLEGWLEGRVWANLTVIKLEGWKRTMWYDQTGLKIWVPPSPNLPTLESCVVYPGTCLFEGVNISEGRGTARPFEYIGAPFINGDEWAKALNAYKLNGVTFEPAEFTPRSIEHVVTNPKYEGQKCGGVFVRVTDREVYEPVKVAVYMLASVKKLYGDKVKWSQSRINRLSGTPKLSQAIDNGVPPGEIVLLWNNDVEKFQTVRKKYLMY